MAAPPVLEHLHPPGVLPGTNEVVLFSGKFDPWPPKVWVDGAGVSFTPETNQGRFRVEVSTNALPGVRFVRAYNAEGASDPRFLVIGSGPEMREAEPNDRFAAPQEIGALPMCVNGRLDKNGDVDSFRVHLEAGEWLEARVDAYSLMSKVDAVLRLVDERGRQLDWNHDFAAFDPALFWRSPVAQSVVVQVFGFKYPADASIQLTGGEGGVYRLSLANRATGEIPEWEGTRETEPNATAAEAGEIQFPGVRVGAMDPAGDVDRYRVRLEAGQYLEASVQAYSLGSPLDAWLAVEDAAGKERVRQDDAEGTRDPALSWKAPEAGEFTVVVGSLTRRGGPAYRYRLRVALGMPEARAKMLATTLGVAPGATNDLKVQWTRLRGHTNAMTLALKGLPDGLSAAPVSAPAGDGEVVLKVVASTDAAPFSGPFQVVCRGDAAEAAAESVVPVELVSRGENNGVPQGYSRLLLESIDHVWLTVTARPTNAPPAAAAAAK